MTEDLQSMYFRINGFILRHLQDCHLKQNSIKEKNTHLVQCAFLKDTKTFSNFCVIHRHCADWSIKT